jgi:hypothetical protein
VATRSAAEGLQSPLGWLWARITAAALAWRAGTSTSRGWHRAALSVPRAISAYLITRWRAVRKSVMALSVCALPMGR